MKKLNDYKLVCRFRFEMLHLKENSVKLDYRKLSSGLPTNSFEKGTLEAFTNVHHDIDGQLDDYRLEEWVTTKK